MNNIMLVEDTELDRYYLKNILPDYNITMAKDGIEALDKLDENLDLILMNIQMPHMDGIKATKEIRKINKDIPIVAYSSQNPNDMPDIFDGYIWKPASKDYVKKTIESYL